VTLIIVLFGWILEHNGKNSDSGIFKESLLYTKPVEKTLNIPYPRPITDNEKIQLPYVIVDEAFGSLENLMRPYGGNLLSHEKKIYNYRHTLQRHRPLDLNIDFAQKIC